VEPERLDGAFSFRWTPQCAGQPGSRVIRPDFAAGGAFSPQFLAGFSFTGRFAAT
jgi:hypothetical protein